jgi:hypothetical protein
MGRTKEYETGAARVAAFRARRRASAAEQLPLVQMERPRDAKLIGCLFPIRGVASAARDDFVKCHHELRERTIYHDKRWLASRDGKRALAQIEELRKAVEAVDRFLEM